MGKLKLGMILPPYRRPAELLFYLRHPSLFEVHVFCDTDTAKVIREYCLPVQIHEVLFKGHGFLSHRIGPAANVSMGDLTLELVDMELIVTVEVFSSISFQASKFATLRRIPHVVICWETLRSNPVFHFPPYSHYTKFVSRMATHIIAATERARSTHIGVGVPEEHISVLYPGSDIVQTENRKFEANRFRILFVGNIARHKGVEDLMCAFSKFLKDDKDLDLLLVGAGPLSSKVCEFALKDRRIDYLGFVSEEEKQRVLASSDVFVYPSRKKSTLFIPRWEEQFGHSVVEAMHHGLPIIATQDGALPEVIGNSGEIVPERNPSELARGIKNLRHEDRWKYLSEASRKRARDKFDIIVQSRLLENTLMAVVVKYPNKSAKSIERTESRNVIS